MDIDINSKSENKLFQREEIRFAITASPTPARDQIKTELCKKLGLSPDQTIVVRIDPLFGSKTSVCLAHAYQNKETLLKFEPKHLLERINKEKKSAPEKKEAPKAEEKKAEAPKAEEKKE